MAYSASDPIYFLISRSSIRLRYLVISFLDRYLNNLRRFPTSSSKVFLADVSFSFSRRCSDKHFIRYVNNAICPSVLPVFFSDPPYFLKNSLFFSFVKYVAIYNVLNLPIVIAWISFSAAKVHFFSILAKYKLIFPFRRMY